MSYSKQIKTIVKIAEDILGIDSNEGKDFASLGICPLPNDQGFQVWIDRPATNTDDRTGPHMQVASHNGAQLFEEKKTLDDALKALHVSLTSIREQSHPTYIIVKGVQYIRADKK